MKSLFVVFVVLLSAGCIYFNDAKPMAALSTTTTGTDQELSAKVLSYEIQPDGSGLMKAEISRAGAGEARLVGFVVQTYDSFGKDVWYLGFESVGVAGGEKKIINASVPASAASKVKSWKIEKLYFEKQ